LKKTCFKTYKSENVVTELRVFFLIRFFSERRKYFLHTKERNQLNYLFGHLNVLRFKTADIANDAVETNKPVFLAVQQYFAYHLQ